ncbi:glycine betaine ABC transporter substrate-binding protein [Geoalkalibacter halelectricus]|uniref:ABC-type glycine betaine transport system substrate-binding domain-containing protein n=1 Tax=Geoalkalibacter halelectricus TaxID=2847045 RepID=A0ABY5ZNL7_9BACT|nr:glycine betaine ABC transporter substrate-binding protein [Geoalkalibacter halelectricus]MDO3379033.1 hypothetical protein [Geoalkalibacter halelectricus]UWZ78846.1 hypothetical protein L9S41_14325 [Geoalkalibacter halelectricus]
MKIKTGRLLVAAVLVLLLGGLAGQAAACVGKTLTLGTTADPQQTLLAEIVALLISERTGTAVNIEQFDSAAAVHDAQLRANVDIVIGYTALGHLDILGAEPLSDPQDLYQTVKARFSQDMNLIWLEPFGFDRQAQTAALVSDQAAPVVRRDTLRRFPALARLIGRLGGTIDEATLAALEEQSQSQPARDVARGFLRENRLI